MEHDRLEEELWENLQHPYKHSDYEPLFEEPEEELEEKGPSLEDRVDTMEYRLGRALLCLNQCQKELAELRKGYRDLTREQSSCQERQDRHRKSVKYGMHAVIILLFLTQMKKLAELGWQLFDKMAQLLNVAPELVSGVLVSIVILCLAVKLGRTVVRAIAKRRKERCEDAVCDR